MEGAVSECAPCYSKLCCLGRPCEWICSGWLRSLAAAPYIFSDGGPSYFRAVRAARRTAPAPVASCSLLTCHTCTQLRRSGRRPPYYTYALRSVTQTQ